MQITYYYHEIVRETIPFYSLSNSILPLLLIVSRCFNNAMAIQGIRRITLIQMSRLKSHGLN